MKTYYYLLGDKSEIEKLITDDNVDVNFKYNNSLTPLHLAVKFGKYQIKNNKIDKSNNLKLNFPNFTDKKNRIR